MSTTSEHHVIMNEELPSQFKLSRSRIMYIENKGDDGLERAALIGRVYFSKSEKTLYYNGRSFRSFKANYYEIASGDYYWISGPHKDQDDRLYGGNKGVHIDYDVREEYAVMIS